MPRRLLLAAALAASLLTPAAASAAPPPLGALTPLTGPGACLTAYPRPDCTEATLAGTKAVVVAPDGTAAYVVSEGALRVFARAADGRLTELAGDGSCVGEPVSGCSPPHIDRFGDAQEVVISPDGRFLYVTLRDADTVHVLSRDATTGRIAPVTGPGGCVQDVTRSTCEVRIPQLNNPGELAFSPDGRFLYVSTFNSSSIWAFARDAATGRITPLAGSGACVDSEGDDGCAPVPGSFRFWDLAVTPDGRHLYSASRDAHAIFGFDLDPATGRLTPMTGAGRCVENGSGFAPGAVCQRTMPGLREPYAVAAAAGGQRLVAVGSDSDSVVSVTVGADGRLAPGSCLTGSGTSTGCPLFSGSLAGAFRLDLSPDRRTAFVAGRDASVVRVVNAAGPELTEHAGPGRCVADSGKPGECATTVQELQNPDLTAFSPDGATAYVHAGGGGEALRAFRVETAPACAAATLSVAFGTAGATTLSCPDANGDPVTHTLADPPAHGAAAVAPDGTATYTPASGFSGTDRFTVVASDGTNTSLPAGVDVAVGARPVVPPPPAPPAGPAAGTPQPPRTVSLAAGRLTLTGRTIALRGERALLPLACSIGTNSCGERVALTAKVRRKGARRASTVTIAVATVGLPAGKRATVPIPLTSAGRGALRDRRRLTVTVVAGTPKRVLTTKGALAKPAAKKKAARRPR